VLKLQDALSNPPLTLLVNVHGVVDSDPMNPPLFWALSVMPSVPFAPYPPAIVAGVVKVATMISEVVIPFEVWMRCMPSAG